MRISVAREINGRPSLLHYGSEQPRIETCTGPLACLLVLLTHLLALLTHTLAPQSALLASPAHSAALIRSFAHSLTPELMGK